MEITIRLLQEQELPIADQILRLAFGTFLGLPEPKAFAGDIHYLVPRWKMNPTAVYGAEVEGQLVGSNIAIPWGSIGFFGPLSVHPDLWNRGIAQRLIEPVLAQLEQWGIEQMGVFTFAHSPKHHALYHKFGFYPRFLTFIMAKSIAAVSTDLPGMRYSELKEAARSQILKDCFELTNAIYEGLDLSLEILAVQTQGLGDTVLLIDDSGLVGFAVCHCGAGTEAGSDTCFVKFGAVRSGVNAGERFERLLDLCESYGAMQGLSRLVAGVNTSHSEAYARMGVRRFRTEIVGVIMQKPNALGYQRSDVFILDDWR